MLPMQEGYKPFIINDITLIELEDKEEIINIEEEVINDYSKTPVCFDDNVFKNYIIPFLARPTFNPLAQKITIKDVKLRFHASLHASFHNDVRKYSFEIIDDIANTAKFKLFLIYQAKMTYITNIMSSAL